MVINETNTTTKENKATGKVNIEPLAVNIETLQDLTDEAQQSIAGGRAVASQGATCIFGDCGTTLGCAPPK